VALVAWHGRPWYQKARTGCPSGVALGCNYSAYTVRLVHAPKYWRVLRANDTPPEELRAVKLFTVQAPEHQLEYINNNNNNKNHIRQCLGTLEVPRADWATQL
jgi:hypothetical protein